MSRRSRVVVNDYAGHAFPIDLSRELVARGHEVTHLYCSSNICPQGDLANDRALLSVEGLSTGSGFDKYKARKRLLAEIVYGVKSAWRLVRVRPDVTLVANMPVVSLAVIRFAAALTRTRCVLWLQDFQAGLAAMALGRRSHPVARALGWLETTLIRRADHVVSISEEFTDEVRLRNVSADRVTTIENWAPIEQIPLRLRDNEWARRHDLGDRLVFLYAGTLGVKHRPQSLIDVARELERLDASARVVVVSEGVGADWLREQLAAGAAPANLVLLPLQPFHELADVVASGDVLLVLLEADASRLSVPSKTLSYLCAGRAVLGLVPSDNAVWSLVADRAQAGLVTDDPEILPKHARVLAEDEDLRRAYGASGRAWAEAHFPIRAIADRFEAILLPERAGADAER